MVRGLFAALLGMVAGSAVRVLASRSGVLALCLCASSVLHLWIGWGNHWERLEQIGIIHYNLIVIANDVYF